MNLYSILMTTIAFFSTLLGGVLAAKYRDNIRIFASCLTGFLLVFTLARIMNI